jgi:signal transduction histidine kinase
LKKTVDPSVKASLYYSLAKSHYGTDQDLAIAYADSAISFGELADFPKMKANAINIKAVSYLIKSDFETSMKLNLEALEIREKIQDTVGLLESHLNLGNILFRSGKSGEAIVWYKKALGYAELANNRRGLSLIYNNLGNYYLTRWKSIEEKTALDSAKLYLNQSLEIKTELQDSRGLINTLLQLAEMAQLEKNFGLAESNLSKALAISEGIDDSELQISLLTQLSAYNLEVGDKRQSLDFAKRAYAIAQKMDSNFEISNTSQYVADAYESLGDYRQALEFSKIKQTAERILNDETKQRIQDDLLIKYESEKKELENQRLLEEKRFSDLSIRRKNELLIGTGIILVGLIAIGFVQRSKNQVLAKTQKELKTTLKQLTDKNDEIEYQALKLGESNTALKESNRIRDRLFSVISHDLKAPIASLRVLLEYWDKKLLTDEEVNEIIPSITKQTSTVQVLLENLLEWAQAQMDYSQLQFTQVNLKELVEESLSLLDMTSKEKKIAILNEVPPAIELHTDRDRLNFIIRNIVSNALKYTKTDGQIHISFLPEGKGIIRIQDNGVGMNRARVESLFSGKLSSSKGTKGEKGSGVGLFLCKEFAESLNANLEVVSKEKEGSVFSIHLG